MSSDRNQHQSTNDNKIVSEIQQDDVPHQRIQSNEMFFKASDIYKYKSTIYTLIDSLKQQSIKEMSVPKPDFVPYEGCTGKWVQARNCPSFVSKSFGFYWCGPCSKTWMSAHAKKGYKQGCKDCNREFYPAYLWVNDSHGHKGEKALVDNEKHHMSSLCQACKKGVCSSSSSSNWFG